MPRNRGIAGSFLSLSLAGAALLSMSGCSMFTTQKQGGRGVSLDQHTYESTTYLPKTVRLVDTRTLEEIWSVDVPVDHKVIVRFYPAQGEASPGSPDVMRWEIIPTSKLGTLLDNQMTVPGKDARRLEWSLRTGPEYAPETGPDGLDLNPDAPGPRGARRHGNLVGPRNGLGG